MSLVVLEIPDGPTCDTCGVPITTGFLAFICPMKERCEFFPDDEDGQRIIREVWASETETEGEQK